MIDIPTLQKQIWQNKEAKGFNTSDIPLEFALTYGEMAELFDAYRKKHDNIGEELADVMIYLLSLARMLDVDLETEIIAKIEKNTQRVYEKRDGINIRISQTH